MHTNSGVNTLDFARKEGIAWTFGFNIMEELEHEVIDGNSMLTIPERALALLEIANKHFHHLLLRFPNAFVRLREIGIYTS